MIILGRGPHRLTRSARAGSWPAAHVAGLSEIEICGPESSLARQLDAGGDACPDCEPFGRLVCLFANRRNEFVLKQSERQLARVRPLVHS